MSYPVSNPKVTLNIVTRDQVVGLDDRRALIIGQKTAAGNAVAGAVTSDIPLGSQVESQINGLFGADSELAMTVRRYRQVNQYTNLDVIALDDDGTATQATAGLTVSGTATNDGTVQIYVASGSELAMELDVVNGQTAAEVRDAINVLINRLTAKPYTAADNGAAGITFTAANGGTIPNNWPIAVVGRVDGMTFDVTPWTGGTVDPDITTLFDPVANIRYQTIVYPETYAHTTLRNYIDPRRNVDNNILEGRAFMYRNEPLAALKATTLALNSSEIVVLANEPTNDPTWQGPHLADAPNSIAAWFAAARDRRYEDGVSISDLVLTNQPLDQFGGRHTSTLPYFNTPLFGMPQPLNGTGFNEAEQREIEDSGITVLGTNITKNGIVMGPAVTTWQNDAAGNADDTWKYLNWRDSHGIIREFFVLNCRERFAQSRLTSGVAVPGYEIADEKAIRAFLGRLYLLLAEEVITVAGNEAYEYFVTNLNVTIKPAERLAEISADTPMVSQLGEIRGTIKFSFETQ